MKIIRNNKGQFAKGTIPFYKGKSNPYKGKLSPVWKGGELETICQYCKKKYFIRKYRIGKTKYCSFSCKGKANFQKEKNPRWKGGISSNKDKLKSSEIYHKWRFKVFQRDRFSCKLCGYRSKKSKSHGDKRSDIEAHHIIPIRRNIKLSLKVGNGITLCEKCHKDTYNKEDKFIKVFKEILNDYMSKIPKG